VSGCGKLLRSAMSDAWRRVITRPVHRSSLSPAKRYLWHAKYINSPRNPLVIRQLRRRRASLSRIRNNSSAQVANSVVRCYWFATNRLTQQLDLISPPRTLPTPIRPHPPAFLLELRPVWSNRDMIYIGGLLCGRRSLFVLMSHRANMFERDPYKKARCRASSCW